jgi:hypothetical protein
VEHIHPCYFFHLYFCHPFFDMVSSLALSALSLLPLVAAYSKTFVVPHVDGKDDSPAVVAALANYSSDSLILFKQGVTYNLWTVCIFVDFSHQQ